MYSKVITWTIIYMYRHVYRLKHGTILYIYIARQYVNTMVAAHGDCQCAVIPQVHACCLTISVRKPQKDINKCL